MEAVEKKEEPQDTVLKYQDHKGLDYYQNCENKLKFIILASCSKDPNVHPEIIPDRSKLCK
jgi:hypothetical protein